MLDGFLLHDFSRRTSLGLVMLKYLETIKFIRIHNHLIGKCVLTVVSQLS